MKTLFIQIPCFNEALTLPIALAALPRKVKGFDSVKWIVINDGSTDRTVEVAQENGVDYVVNHVRNQGLARAFMTGIEACVQLGADVIVNTDADNQYNADDIPLLTAPILEGRAEIVIGTRPIDQVEHFSTMKKFLQKFGSWVVRIASKTDISDTTSGFRALSREAARQIVVFTDYTYTLETIIQAGQKNMAIISVPIRVNPFLRPSRLIKSIASYINRSIITIVRIFIIYQPFKFFASLSLILFCLGTLIGFRFLYFLSIGMGGGHIQSLILASILLLMGFQSFLIAFIADLLAANRKLLENIRFKINKAETENTNNIKITGNK
jgi:glycosyltransferase involved in cell wall biosynthesis